MKNIKFFKIIVVKILLLATIVNQGVFAKPIPPGSGQGDVPANILFLLDSSDSMDTGILSGAPMREAEDIVELNDGNLIVAQWTEGLIKLTYSTGERDYEFAVGGHFVGAENPDALDTVYGTGNCAGKDSRLLRVSEIAYDKTSNIIYALDYETNNYKIVSLNPDGTCVDVIEAGDVIGDGGQELNFSLKSIDIRNIDREEHMFVIGYDYTAARHKKGRLFSKNLTTGVGIVCPGLETKHFDGWTKKNTDISVTSDGSKLYSVNNGHMIRYNMSKINTNEDGATDNYCPTVGPGGTVVDTSGRGYDAFYHNHRVDFSNARAIALDPDDDNTIYVADLSDHNVKKFTIGDGDDALTLVKEKGIFGKTNVTDDSNLVFKKVRGITIGTVNKSSANNNVLYVGDVKPTIEVLDRGTDNMTWVKEIGGPKVMRLTGAINAIKAVLNDSTLTSGAHFGYGYWNSGTPETDERRCHGNLSADCEYYRGWNNATEEGPHPGGQSNLCEKDSCLMVGIHDQGAEKILEVIGDTDMEWGTDGRAFSQMAYKYFTDTTITTNPPVDPHSSCQLRYVIVIGDGGWKHAPTAEGLIRKLRTEKDVKTLVVAYGGGIDDDALINFADMAVAGSCDNENDSDCEPAIIADTPQQLKTALQSKIQQIIAERLAFTAPTITASIEKGGNVYQAQFDYMQHGEWEGTVRKTKIVDGEPDFDDVDNWSASEKMYEQTKRKIWTAMPEDTYLGDWDNFTTTEAINVSGIKNLFQLFDYDVLDYHRVTARSDGSTIGTRCGGEHENGYAKAEVIEGTSVADGIDDDVVGLINFVRGKDFFDYDGDCILTEKRLKMLGDIYHSQLVEVGQPNAFTSFTSTNQESYWRAKNNYQSFVTDHESREKIVYAGANDGMLHAFNAGSGEEEWAFVPPFIAAKLPTMMNEGLNGTVGENKTGGSSAIFAVDGSPVIHDIFYKGIKPDGTFDVEPSWHTIMIIPYGRGGRGFSILDITHPIIETEKGPVHIVSIFNDKDNRKIWMADHEGTRQSWEYLVSEFHLRDSLEGQKARDNERKGRNASPSTIDDIYECQANGDASSGSFKTDGTNSCYKGKTFSFNPATAESFSATDLRITENSALLTPTVNYTVDTSCGARLCINFTSDKIVSSSRSELKTDFTSSINIKITNDVIAGLANTPEYDYSSLGETWSSPRIFRLPNEGAGDSDINDDIYAAILPSGMGSESSVFIINLEAVQTEDKPGKIIKRIKIEDAKFEDGGSNITNAIPSSPIVITPDIGHGIEWNGALAYVGDFEGKITKINLTNIVAPGIEMYDHSTLFNLNSSTENGRYLYHMMDAGIGRDTKQLWLFGGTGDFENINGTSDTMDNILFGIRDFDYPNYKHIPTPTNDVDNLVGINECVDTSLLGSAADCSVAASNSGWVYHLDNENTLLKHRKSSAAPTIYRGNVYFPVYKPFEGQDKCNLGSAYICSADDECGINNSEKIPEYAPSEAEEDACMFIRRGILSELVIFGDTLFGNVAGPSEDVDTLISILASAGEVDTYRGSWRENY